MVTCRTLFVCLVAVLAIHGALLAASRPRIVAGAADREAVVAKIDHMEWAKKSYAELRARIDPLVERTQADPKYVISRLMMNWEKPYKTPIVEKSRFVRGDGAASVPTPRYAGARNWVTDYVLPERFEEWQPYNDQAGKVRLLNRNTKQMEWIEPGITGRQIELANEQVLRYAKEAGFLYWVSGDEKYAKFAAEILCTYMDGFAQLEFPKPAARDEKMMSIIGPTSFEVIHEGGIAEVAIAYDFLASYLKTQGKNTRQIEDDLRRWAQAIVDGGGRDSNWNVIQAGFILKAGLALDDNDAYADGRGRQYFVDIVLNADLPRQRGLTYVIKEGFDYKSFLWPEAAGYGMGTAAGFIEMAYALRDDPAGKVLLQDSLLPRAMANQRELLYANGLSNGVGDTTNHRPRIDAVETMLAFARQRGDRELESALASLIATEIAEGRYDRAKNSDPFALANYVDALPPVNGTTVAARTFWFDGMNLLMLRNNAAGEGRPTDPVYSLGATLFGTDGGHVHANGMAIELYGAGFILGADPGRGSSYWDKDHGEYYKTPPAHNTVIVNGTSTYDEYKSPLRMMRLEDIEPASQKPALSPSVSFARGAFDYASPQANQQRTLALIRTGPTSGFYFDVFRSRGAPSGNAPAFHDYLYHNMGSLIGASRADQGTELKLAPSSVLAEPSLLKGYSYFKNERSIATEATVKSRWSLTVGDRSAGMDLWMLGAPGRTVFAVDAPANRAPRGSLPDDVWSRPMPTIVVRHAGADAWREPFVAIFEPFANAEGSTITSVRAAKVDGAVDASVVATVVQGKTREGASYRARLFQDADPTAAISADGVTSHAAFSVVVEQDGAPGELYLAGNSVRAGLFALAGGEGRAVHASLRRDGDAWRCSADQDLRVEIAFAVPESTSDTEGWSLENVNDASLRLVTSPDGTKVIVVEATVTAGMDRLLALRAR